MHFCSVCDNMYYIKINEGTGDTLKYYCRNCGHEETDINEDNICVSRTQLKQTQQKFDNIINKYTKFDTRLPHVYNVLCPNEICATNKKTSNDDDVKTQKVNNDVIYLRYDNADMKYVYMCTHCDTLWNTDGH